MSCFQQGMNGCVPGPSPVGDRWPAGHGDADGSGAGTFSSSS